MHYLGGKQKLAPLLAPILWGEIEAKNIGTFVEPFCGAFNIVPAMKKYYNKNINYICADSDLSLISLLKSLQKGWLPTKKVEEADYKWIKENIEETDPLHGFCAFGMSYSGKKWGGFTRSNPKNRCYHSNAVNSLKRKTPYMENVTFLHAKYEELEINRNSLIYCDPPYKNTTGYKDNKFSHEDFEKWATEKAKENSVYISEYKGAYDFTQVFQYEKIRDLKSNTQTTATEVLYKI